MTMKRLYKVKEKNEVHNKHNMQTYEGCLYAFYLSMAAFLKKTKPYLYYKYHYEQKLLIKQFEITFIAYISNLEVS